MNRYSSYSGGSRPSDEGGGGGGGVGGGHPDSETREGTSLQKSFFQPFGPHFALKLREQGGQVPWTPPQIPPLVTLCNTL